MGELLGALGMAWPRLLIYPGGLFALAAARLLALWLARCGLGAARSSGRPSLAEVALIVPPLAALSLLPLAPARSFPYGLDLMIALALLEWPRLPELPQHSRGALTRAYAPLLVAGTGMAAACGGLELVRLLRMPEAWGERGLLLISATLWLAALPRLLAGSPPGLAGQLRALGLLLVAVLPALGALAAWAAPLVPTNLAGWVLPPLAMLITAAALGACAMLPRAPLARAELALGAGVVVLMAATVLWW